MDRAVITHSNVEARSVLDIIVSTPLGCTLVSYLFLEPMV
jgi:hypothetical protein